jgi:hypothetical protein
VMLNELRESTASSNRWITYTKYGTSGGTQAKVVESTNHAAVIGYDDSQPDLSVSLQSTQGMITYSTYGDSTEKSNGSNLFVSFTS